MRRVAFFLDLQCVVILGVVILGVVMMSVTKMSVVMLSVVMLNVVAPSSGLFSCLAVNHIKLFFTRC